MMRCRRLVTRYKCKAESRAARVYRYPLAEVTGRVLVNIEGGAFKCRQSIQDLAERL